MSPWTWEEFQEKNKDFTDAQAKVAAKVANAALTACLDAGKSQDDCEVSAIRQGLSVGAKQVKEVKEGMLADEVAAQKAESEVNDFIWKAQSLIGDVMRDIAMSTQVKKDKISGILDDLDVELVKRADTVMELVKRRAKENLSTVLSY